jgi:hypothetical protein
MKVLSAMFLAFVPMLSPQTTAVPPFTGTWKLDIHRTTFIGKPHPPIAATVVIRYDGAHWYRWRSHTAATGSVDSSSMRLVVGSPKPQVTKAGPLTVYSRLKRDGEALVLSQEFIANTGERATNTVRYSLADHGNTLIEDEREVSPAGNETNHWVSTRQK